MDKRYQRHPLDDARNIVPVGPHIASDGSLAFDEQTPELVEDIQEFMRAFVDLRPTPDQTPAFRLFEQNSAKTLQVQRDYLSQITDHTLRQLGPSDEGEQRSAKRMLASSFDSFPAFIDFLDLTCGCGDPVADPLMTRSDDEEAAA